MSNSLPKQFQHPFAIDKKYKKSVAYFSMEFAIDQSLKIYSGGLGFLAGSHMRSAYDLKQNLIGIGVLWKYGYYDKFKKEHSSFLQFIKGISDKTNITSDSESASIVHHHLSTISFTAYMCNTPRSNNSSTYWRCLGMRRVIRSLIGAILLSTRNKGIRFTITDIEEESALLPQNNPHDCLRNLCFYNANAMPIVSLLQALLN